MSFDARTHGRNSNARDARLGWLVGFLLLAITLAVYWPVGRFPFTGVDDQEYVTENMQVQRGLTGQGLWWAFTNVEAANWHPLTWLSHMLDCQLFELNAGGHHWTSLVFHLANTLLLFVVFKQMTGAVWRSAWVAALFALHPLHVESVTWVSERKDVLSTCFFMLTLWAYSRYAQKGRAGSPLPAAVVDTSGAHGVTRPTIEIGARAPGFYWLALLFFAFGLMSKPMLVTLPFVLLLLDCWPLRRFEFGFGRAPRHRMSGLLLEKLPFFLLAAVSAAVTFVAQREGGAVGSLTRFPLSIRLANVLTSYARYLRRLVWPDDLAVFYPYPDSFSAWEIALAGMLLAALSVAVVAGLRHQPWLAVGWAWFLGTLVPVIGLVQVGWQSMADRYTYIPLIGVFVMIAWAMPELASRWRYGRVALGLAATAALGACVVATTLQLRYWQNDGKLFSRALAVTRNNSLAHNGLGTALYRQGEFAEAKAHYLAAMELTSNDYLSHYNLGLILCQEKNFDEGIPLFAAALQINPRYAKAHIAWGSALVSQGKLEEAIMHYHDALHLDPDNPVAHYNLGTALYSRGEFVEAKAHYLAAMQRTSNDYLSHYNLGLILCQEKKFDEAIPHFATALRLNPRYAKAHTAWGSALVGQGHLEAAIIQYHDALHLDPDDPVTQQNLGRILLARGQVNEAMEHFAAALRVKPDDVATRAEFGAALAGQGKLGEAIGHFTAALRVKPDEPQLHKLLARALAEQGKLPDAIVHYSAALQCNPRDAEALNGLGRALVAQGKMDEAIAPLSRALEVETNSADTHALLGQAFKRQGKTLEAVACFRTAVRLQSDSPEVLNSLAWVLATHPDAQFRDGNQAVAFAAQAVELTRTNDAAVLDTLAAAFAEAGRFAESVVTATKAVALAEASGAPQLAAEIEARLRLYGQSQPFRDRQSEKLKR